ncbi:MAG: HEAT repeat domain-containing protein [Myxococcaceae bacterium]
MPKQTVRKLHDDVGRVLVAGAHLAAGDSELQKDQAALQSLATQLGAKAPVLGQLADAVGKAVNAPGKEAASSLLQVAAMASQVRAAQATMASVDGGLEPLEVVPEIGTPCNARDIYELRDALLVKGEGRMPKLEQAIERGDIADLRLVEAVVRAMGDAWIGEKVTTDAVPLLGKAVVAPIRRKLDLKGGVIDGRRLRAAVAVEKEGARDLLEKGMREGSSDVREAALDAVADYVRGVKEFEPLVLELIAKEKSGEVKRAAVRALAGYGSDESLDALLTYFDKTGTKGKYRHAAVEALGGSKNPKVVDRLLEKLDAQIAAKPKKGKKDEDALEGTYALLDALAPHEDARIATRAVELIDAYGVHAANAVVRSGNPKQLAVIADQLSGTEVELFEPAVQAAVRLGGDDTYKRLSAPFTAKDNHTKTGLARLRAVQGALTGGHHHRWRYYSEESQPTPQFAADKRWGTLLLKALVEDSGVAEIAIQLLGAFKEKSSVKPLVKILDTSKSQNLVNAAIHALGAIGDPAALDSMIDKLESNTYGWSLRYAILAINDPSSVAKVRTLVAGIKDIDNYKHWYLRNLLNSLENRFPGS